MSGKGAASLQTGLALQGGGFLSIMCFTGLTVGMLALQGQLGGNGTTLAGSGLFQRIDAVSSVSGGSWFAGELLYSSRFVSLLEAMAASPQEAGALFGKEWMDKWLAVGSSQNSMLAEVVEMFDFGDMVPFIKELGFFWDKGGQWSSFTKSLLNATVGLGPEVTLDANVSDWCRGKMWLVDHAVVAGSGTSPVNLYHRLGMTIKYHVVNTGGGAPEPPLYIPASFSVSLGAEPGTAAPLPYTAPSAAAALDAIQYHKASFWPETTTSGSFENFPAASSEVGSLPLFEVLAASSAALGGLCLSTSWIYFKDRFGLHMTPWMSTTGQGRAFSQAEEIIYGLDEVDGYSGFNQALENMAAAKVRGVIDGGYVDSMAIAALVGNGASEVMAMMDWHGDDPPDEFYNLFQNATLSKTVAGVQKLFNPIFAESIEVAQEAYIKLPRLQLVPGTQYLTSITVGKINVTTAENRWFGVTAGRPVTIWVAAVASTLNIGQFADFPKYNRLIQEIVSCLTAPENTEIVRSGLLAPLLPSLEAPAEPRVNGTAVNSTA